MPMSKTMLGSRLARRAAIHMERRGLRGDWGKWRVNHLPEGGPGRGWLRHVTRTYANNLYAVLVRPVETDWGLVHHLAIRTASNLEPPWRDKQRIKDELFGESMTAVEVMPPHDEIVDGADMYHLWVFDQPLPFSLRTAQ